MKNKLEIYLENFYRETDKEEICLWMYTSEKSPVIPDVLNNLAVEAYSDSSCEGVKIPFETTEDLLNFVTDLYEYVGSYLMNVDLDLPEFRGMTKEQADSLVKENLTGLQVHCWDEGSLNYSIDSSFSTISNLKFIIDSYKTICSKIEC